MVTLAVSLYCLSPILSHSVGRYSTDQRWHVPHFEKMLYDQAQLTHSFLDAYIVTGQSKYSLVARDILTYVMRDLSHPVSVSSCDWCFYF